MFVILLALTAVFAHAEEGFDANPPADPALRRAWDSTAAIYLWTKTTNGVGSAVVVRHEGREIYLLTANHVLLTLCATSACDNVAIYENLEFDWTKESLPRHDPLAVRFDVIDRDPDRDLALIRIVSDWPAEPIPIALKCPTEQQPLFGIGFPVTAERPDPLNIGQPRILTKRLAKGVFLNRVSLMPDGRIVSGTNLPGSLPIVQTSVDATHGSSGEPLLNDQGELAGLVTKVDSLADDSSYQGRGESVFRQINAKAVPCEDLITFMKYANPR